jgi:hypothetical protein
MNRHALAAIACVLLSGCATTGDVMQRQTVRTLASPHAVAEVVGCMAPRIVRDWGESKTTPAGRGTMIAVSASAWGNPIAVIDVQPGDTGSTIAIRRGPSADRVFAGIVRIAQACR